MTNFPTNVAQFFNDVFVDFENCHLKLVSRYKLDRTSQDSAIIYMAVKGQFRLATIICENAVGQCVNASMCQCVNVSMRQCKM